MSTISVSLKKYEKINISRVLLYILIFLIPVNLGYHFEIKEAYVNGLLIDYLVPVIYFQDILVALIVLLNFKKIRLGLYSYDKFLTWFIFSILLSVFLSSGFLSSGASFLRFILYVLFMLCLRSFFDLKRELPVLVKTFALSVIALSFLSFAQWFRQGSVFDNYLIFGEQPYTLSTPGINVENFFGVSKVPPYATFRHPNILGGFLSIVLVWLLFNLKRGFLPKIAFVLGFVTLFLTLAKFAWISFLIGSFAFMLYKKKVRGWKILLIFFTTASLVISLFLPVLDKAGIFSEEPSFYRRSHLTSASYKIMREFPLFGVGHNSSTAYIDRYLPPRNDIRFAQPPHNIFLLLAVESGVITLFLFLLFYALKIRMSYHEPVLFISLMQFVFLGSFDHYLFTMHQTQLLFWLILGFF